MTTSSGALQKGAWYVKQDIHSCTGEVYYHVLAYLPAPHTVNSPRTKSTGSLGIAKGRHRS